MFRKIAVLCLLLMLSACASQKENPIEGTWRMVSGRYVEPDADVVITTDEHTRFAIKVLGPSHFSVVEMFKENPDSLFFAAVGTYRLDGDKYIEQYEASNVGYQVGTSREFSFALVTDSLTISSSRGNMELHEVWVRVQ